MRMEGSVRSKLSSINDRSKSLLDRASVVASFANERGAERDVDGAFPDEEIAQLHSTGLLMAPFPSSLGGADLGVGDSDRLREVLICLGSGSLALGRLYEGHVNAVALAVRYGSRANLLLLKQEAMHGRPSGVWMAGKSLRLEKGDGGNWLLRGQKVLCSGAGSFRRPLVAADLDGGSIMVIPLIEQTERADISQWTAQGMRATATGSVDFDHVEIGEDEFVGAPGDYLRAPHFKGGAWRVLAVQLGGLEAILQMYRAQLRDSAYCDHPIQLARFGQAEIACETARLWVREAAQLAEGSVQDASSIDAYVDLARNAFEDSALRVVALAQKAIGLKAFLRPNPLERLIRDLTTYLRQPALDASLLSAAQYALKSERQTP